MTNNAGARKPPPRGSFRSTPRHRQEPYDAGVKCCKSICGEPSTKPPAASMSPPILRATPRRSKERTHDWRKLLSILGAILFTLATVVIATAQQYQVQQNSQAVTIAQTAFSAMGGSSAFSAYQDSVATGTLTLYVGGTVSYPITSKTKGTQETRIEVQIPLECFRNVHGCDRNHT